MKVIYPAHISTRQKPKNLKKDDIEIFFAEFSPNIDETTILELKNISILKDIIFDLSKKKFYFLNTHVNYSTTKKLFKKFLFFLYPKNDKKIIEEAIWITDEWSHDYFHWLTDALTRLIAVEKFSNSNSLTVILPKTYSKYTYINESLELLGYKMHFYNSQKRFFVKKLILPSHTAITGNYNKEIIQTLRDRFLQKKDILDPPHRNIFISRTKASKRKITNETEVRELLKRYNYEVHFFEDYTLKKQIVIMSQTKTLIGLHGAGLVNMLFMPENGQVLELRIKNDSHNNCYFVLASDLKQNYYYQQNKKDLDNVIVDLQELETNLEAMTS